MRSYAIGDIHGHLDKLEEAHRLIDADRAATGESAAGPGAAPVVHIGDLVDRGPDSRGVIDHLIRGMDNGAPWVVIKGNHDRMFADFMRDPDSHDPGLRIDLNWIHPRLGGSDTLASYGVLNAAERLLHDLHEEAAASIPEAHLHFLRGLPTSFRHGGALFVHAGIRPGIPLAAQSEDDLLWIRKEFHEFNGDHGVLVVHGHTPVDTVVHYGNRLNIDTGAGYGKPLSTVVIEGTQVWRLTAKGRVPVLPEGVKA